MDLLTQTWDHNRAWHPSGHHWDYYPGALFFESSHCKLFGDQALVDEIYGCLIFKWVSETWQHDRVRIKAPAIAARWHAQFPNYYGIWCPFYQHPYGSTLIPAWVHNYIHYKMWDEITNPFPDFNGANVEVWEWDKLFHTTLHCTRDYLSMLGLRLIHVSKRGPWWNVIGYFETCHPYILKWLIAQ